MVTIIKNGKIVTKDSVFNSDIKIVDGKISEISPDIQCDDAQLVDAEGKYVLPGAIDSHTHLDLDTGITKTADDFTSGSKAALVGGTTTFIDFATQDKGATLDDALLVWNEKADHKTYCDYGFHMAITDWNERTKADMKKMIIAGIPTFKMYMAYKGSLQVDDAVIYEALEESAKIGALVGFHCENGDLIDARVKENISQGHTGPYYHAQTRPSNVESEAVNRLMTISNLAGAPVWVVHLSTKEGLNFIREARIRGQEVVAETCPQYLVLDVSKYGNPTDTNFDAAKYVMSPPLRDLEDQGALWEGIARHEIDFISTDHCSFNMKGQKELGREDYSKIPNGGAGIEDRVLLLYTYGVCEDKISISDMVALLCENPARKMGLNNKGSIEVGKDADLVILDPNHEDVFSVKTQTQHVDYNGYEGMRRKGKIEQVFLRGIQVVSNGKVVGEPKGKFVHRSFQ
ncbi:MAG TPA: dihydropyrimidinase [Candidatus Merdenecus merdavium]|nr:dihydropyrimidinase [Candidatus Merdenecus merdavium]